MLSPKTKSPFLPALLIALLLSGCGKGKVSPSAETKSGSLAVSRADLAGLDSWTKNPELIKETGLWSMRTFCWTIGADCPDDLLLSLSDWNDDGDVYLRAEDDNTHDLGCDCAAMTQGTGTDGVTVHGHPLERLRIGDLEAAYILLERSDAGAEGCTGVAGAGNIVNLWLRHPDGSIWVTDLYLETRGLDSGFKQRAAPHNRLVTLFSPLPWERGHDWYAYQIRLWEWPELYSRTRRADGTESIVIDLKALLEKGAKFSGRDLADYEWQYVDLVCEDVCVGGKAGQSAAWQRVGYFEIKIEKAGAGRD